MHSRPVPLPAIQLPVGRGDWSVHPKAKYRAKAPMRAPAPHAVLHHPKARQAVPRHSSPGFPANSARDTHHPPGQALPQHRKSHRHSRKDQVPDPKRAAWRLVAESACRLLLQSARRQSSAALICPSHSARPAPAFRRAPRKARRHPATAWYQSPGGYPAGSEAGVRPSATPQRGRAS